MGVLVTLIGVMALRLSVVIGIVVGAITACSAYTSGSGVFSVSMQFFGYSILSGGIIAVVGLVICAIGAAIIGLSKPMW